MIKQKSKMENRKLKLPIGIQTLENLQLKILIKDE